MCGKSSVPLEILSVFLHSTTRRTIETAFWTTDILQSKTTAIENPASRWMVFIHAINKCSRAQHLVWQHYTTKPTKCLSQGGASTAVATYNKCHIAAGGWPAARHIDEQTGFEVFAWGCVVAN